ncbi:hypothetical protein Pelo_11317 [Pelomyxa schiedti]|nr:hypothetical protein Pelo_11317 [Pelomyxa schiedti]
MPLLVDGCAMIRKFAPPSSSWPSYIQIAKRVARFVNTMRRFGFRLIVVIDGGVDLEKRGVWEQRRREEARHLALSYSLITGEKLCTVSATGDEPQLWDEDYDDDDDGEDNNNNSNNSLDDNDNDGDEEEEASPDKDGECRPGEESPCVEIVAETPPENPAIGDVDGRLEGSDIYPVCCAVPSVPLAPSLQTRQEEELPSQQQQQQQLQLQPDTPPLVQIANQTPTVQVDKAGTEPIALIPSCDHLPDPTPITTAPAPTIQAVGLQQIQTNPQYDTHICRHCASQHNTVLHLPKKLWVTPESIRVALYESFKATGCKVIFSVAGADREAASLCISEGCYGVLSCDTDFLLFPGVVRWLDSSTLRERNQSLFVDLYEQSQLCQCLGLSAHHLPLLSVLKGNDFFSSTQLLLTIGGSIRKLADFAASCGAYDVIQFASSHPLLAHFGSAIKNALILSMPLSPQDALQSTLSPKIPPSMWEALSSFDTPPMIRSMCQGSYFKGPLFEVPNRPSISEITRPIRQAICNFALTAGSIVHDITISVKELRVVEVDLVSTGESQSAQSLEQLLSILSISHVLPVVNRLMLLPCGNCVAAVVIAVAYLLRRDHLDLCAAVALIAQAIVTAFPSLLELTYTPEIGSCLKPRPLCPMHMYSSALFLYSLSSLKELNWALGRPIGPIFTWKTFDGRLFSNLIWWWHDCESEVRQEDRRENPDEDIPQCFSDVLKLSSNLCVLLKKISLEPQSVNDCLMELDKNAILQIPTKPAITRVSKQATPPVPVPVAVPIPIPSPASKPTTSITVPPSASESTTSNYALFSNPNTSTVPIDPPTAGTTAATVPNHTAAATTTVQNNIPATTAGPATVPTTPTSVLPNTTLPTTITPYDTVTIPDIDPTSAVPAVPTNPIQFPAAAIATTTTNTDTATTTMAVFSHTSPIPNAPSKHCIPTTTTATTATTTPEHSTLPCTESHQPQKQKPKPELAYSCVPFFRNAQPQPLLTDPRYYITTPQQPQYPPQSNYSCHYSSSTLPYYY